MYREGRQCSLSCAFRKMLGFMCHRESTGLLIARCPATDVTELVGGNFPDSSIHKQHITICFIFASFSVQSSQLHTSTLSSNTASTFMLIPFMTFHTLLIKNKSDSPLHYLTRFHFETSTFICTTLEFSLNVRHYVDFEFHRSTYEETSCTNFQA